MENRAHKIRTRNSKPILFALATSAWFFASRDADAAAVEISYFGGNVGKQHYRSDGTTPIPVDSGFYFEIGAFTYGFDPRTESTDNWLGAWSAVTDTNNVPLPNATTEFTTQTSIGIEFPGFGEKVDLEHNNGNFLAGNRGYIWGYNTRTDPGDAEWILISHIDSMNPGDEWRVPFFGIGASRSWTLGNANTAIVGLGNGTNGVDNNLIANAEMTMFAVTIPGPVPEPTSAALLGLVACAVGLRRRR